MSISNEISCAAPIKLPTAIEAAFMAKKAKERIEAEENAEKIREQKREEEMITKQILESTNLGSRNYLFGNISEKSFIFLKEKGYLVKRPNILVVSVSW